MYFDSVAAALEMEGHGGFVWAAYAITFFVLVLIVALPLRRRRRVLRQLDGQMRRETAVSQAGQGR
ncbi:MAG: heme exporter protein CcmD [Halioglobus sp.]